MSITVSKNAGFCPGVRRADTEIRKLIENRADDQVIHTLGHLIHNGIYNDELKRNGVDSVELDGVENILISQPDKRVTLVLRTHGVTVEVEESLRTLGEKYGNLEVVDMTCPYVKKIHKIAEDNTGDDTYFVLFGNKSHPESIGIISRA